MPWRWRRDFAIQVLGNPSSVCFADTFPSGKPNPSGNPFKKKRILRCAQNDIVLSLRAFKEGVAIRSN